MEEEEKPGRDYLVNGEQEAVNSKRGRLEGMGKKTH